MLRLTFPCRNRLRRPLGVFAAVSALVISLVRRASEESYGALRGTPLEFAALLILLYDRVRVYCFKFILQIPSDCRVIGERNRGQTYHECGNASEAAG